MQISRKIVYRQILLNNMFRYERIFMLHIQYCRPPKLPNFLYSSNRLLGGGAPMSQCCSDFLLQRAGDIEADHTDSGIAMDCADQDRKIPHLGDLTTTATCLAARKMEFHDLDSTNYATSVQRLRVELMSSFPEFRRDEIKVKWFCLGSGSQS